MMEIPDLPKPELPEKGRARAFGFSPEERRKYYEEYLAESLERDFPPEQHREMNRRYGLLMECLVALDTEKGSESFRERLTDEATGFADCVVSSKVRPDRVYGDLERWSGEQKTCHQNVQEIVREVSERIGTMSGIPEATKIAVRELAAEEHIFFNAFALFIAYAEVLPSGDGE